MGRKVLSIMYEYKVTSMCLHVKWYKTLQNTSRSSLCMMLGAAFQ